MLELRTKMNLTIKRTNYQQHHYLVIIYTRIQYQYQQKYIQKTYRRNILLVHESELENTNIQCKNQKNIIIEYRTTAKFIENKNTREKRNDN